MQQLIEDIKNNIFLSTNEKIADDQLIGTIITDSLEFVYVISEIENEFEVNLPEVDMSPIDIAKTIINQRPELCNTPN
jgi:acyl carrier protein